MEVAEQKNKITMVSGAGALAITNEKCTANNVHWTYDFYGISNGAGKAVVNQGKKNWYFITADYKFGADLEKYTTASINANNGKVLSTTKTVLNTSDFSSYLLKAKNSGADVVALATAGQDTINAIKQASAPANGINKTKQTIFPLLMFISDVHSLGLDIAQELYVVESFYWDRDNKTRAWSNKFMKIYKKMPTSIQAGIYSSVLAYLNAVQKAGTDDTQAVMKALKSTNINDGLFTGKIRADGKFVHDMYLYQVKKPSESRHLWDYYKPLAVISATDATLPLSQSNCKLVKKSINK